MNLKNDKVKFLLCLLFFAILAAITFRCTWPADHVFSASDLNIGRLAYTKSILPEVFIGYFRGTELMGASGYGISLLNLLLFVLPLDFFANVFYGAVLVSGSLAMVWYLRMWNRSWGAAVFGALVSFWVNSIMLASGGHANKMEVLMLSVLVLGMIEKAVRSDRVGRAAGFALLAGLAVGIMMLEQQDVGLLAGLFVGSYAIFRLVRLRSRSACHWLVVLILVSVVSLLLSGSTLLKSYDQNIKKATTVLGETENKWNFITQWSLVPDEWPDLIAPGWGGWSSNNPDAPYWGKLGQSAEWESSKQGFRNFKLTSNYIGIIPFLLGAFGFIAALRNRKDEEAKTIIFWSTAGLIGFWLAFGKFSVLYKLFYHLPLVGNIRAPIKLLDNFQICLGIVAAYGLDRLLGEGRAAKPAKVLWIASAVLGGLMLFAGLRLLAFPAGQAAVFSKMGFGNYADVMVQNMANGWVHGAVLSLFAAGLVFVAWKGWKPAKSVAAVFVFALAADSLLLTSHYFDATDISALKRGNLVVNFIKQNQGNERTIFLDSQGIYNQWIASDGPFHGLNLFNIWQMPRMPDDYKEFLGTVGGNQIRLWELSAIKYIAAPVEILRQLEQNSQLSKLFQPVLNYQVPAAQGMRQDVLLEFKGSVPRFALFSGWESIAPENQCQTLASPQHNPRSTVLLDPAANLGQRDSTTGFQPLEAQTTKRKATVRVDATTDSILRFSQYFQTGWTVRVDGRPAKLLRVDYLCMGVAVPSGEHVVEFRCIDGTLQAGFMLGVFLLSVAAAAWLLRSAKKRQI